MQEIRPLDIWRNKKNGQNYQVKGFAKHSETQEDMIIYTAMYGDQGTYVRPRDLFLEKFALIRRSAYGRKEQ